MNELKVNEIVNYITEAPKSIKDELYEINTSNVERGRILFCPLTKKNELKGQFKKGIKNNDILFSEIRPQNKHYYKVNLQNPEDYVASTKLMVLRKFNNCVDLDYFYYWLTSNATLEILQSRAENRICSFPQITFDLLSEFLVPVPSLKTQKKISNILKILDKKIECNNKTIQTLESLAKTIYDYWFLQFEFPNEEGKPYKSSGGKMVWNEELKREIPEEWEVKKLGEIFNLVKGKIPNDALSNKMNETNSIPYITIDVANGGITQYCNPDNMVKLDGETIMVMDGAASGDVYVGNKGILGSTFSKLISMRKDISDRFIYEILNSNKVIYKKANTGSTVPHANSNFIRAMKIPLPKNCDYYSKTFNSIGDNIINLKQQNQQLASLRDWLLPMLMNGQVTFKEDSNE